MKFEEIISQESFIILLSIRENYFDSMISGNKKYEYRKRYRKVKTKALIYISKTKKSIVGIVEFGEPIVGNSECISRFSAQNGDSNYHDMKEYLGTNNECYAIPIEKFTYLKNHLQP